MKPVVVAENVFKKYSRNANRHLNYGVSDLMREIFGQRRNMELRKDEFFAVNDISLALNPGDTLGLVGRNGSGKTTLLRMLNGLIKPDAGRIMIDGRVQALIALGTGFNPKLTGRDNIFNAAALMGMSRRETSGILDEIIDFAELDAFIDSPVETYSSGMFARLGFSVSIHLRPEILLIDEILSVGDAAFQNKCFIKMHQMKKEGVTIILVSHSHTHISQICDTALWIQNGKSAKMGPAKEVITDYLTFLDEQEVRRVEELNRLKSENRRKAPRNQTNAALYGAIYDDTDNIEDLTVEFLVGGRKSDVIRLHEPLTIRYGFSLKKKVKDLNVTLGFYRKDGLHYTTISTLNGDLLTHQHTGRVRCEITIPDFNFTPGKYVLVMPIHEGHAYLYRNVVKEFTVINTRRMTWGLLDCSYDYKVFNPEHPEEVALEIAPGGLATENGSAAEPIGAVADLPEGLTVDDDALGPELAPHRADEADGRGEAERLACYTGIYEAKVSVVDSAMEPGAKGTGSYCLRVESDGANRSGIRQGKERFRVEGGRRYLIRCKVHCRTMQAGFRLSVKHDQLGNLWAHDVETGNMSFMNNAREWTQFQGIVTIPEGGDGLGQLWLIHWEPERLTWYLDDPSIRRITDSSLLA